MVIVSTKVRDFVTLHEEEVKVFDNMRRGLFSLFEVPSKTCGEHKYSYGRREA